MSSSLQGQTAWVFGGASGIGLATARLLAEARAQVIVAGRSHERLQAALAALPAGVAGEAVDAADAEALAAAFARRGRFEHLVLSIGASSVIGPYRQMTEDGLRRTFEGKYWAYQRTTLAALPHMQGGSISWVTGAAARAAIPGMAALAATNGALHAMVGPLARELAPIRVNAVAPGFIDTPMTQALSDRAREALFSQIPMGRLGTADDVARAVAFFISDDATYITGQVMHVNGGLYT